MKQQLGLPYMGAKRKISGKLIDKILEETPECTTFYDLFGGGGGMSFKALEYPQMKKVVYNELSTGVVSLLQKLRTEGVTEELFTWVTREKFREYRTRTDWLGGLMVVWAFANNPTRGYLFSKDSEKYEETLHNAVVTRCRTDRDTLAYKYGLVISEEAWSVREILPRKQQILKELSANNRITKSKKDMRSEALNRLQLVSQVAEALATPAAREKLTLLNLSYEQVPIDTEGGEVVIYLDPPYEHTARYKLSIDHEVLYKFMRESPHKVYLSSYSAPFREVMSLSKVCTLPSDSGRLTREEKLYCNR